MPDVRLRLFDSYKWVPVIIYSFLFGSSLYIFKHLTSINASQHSYFVFVSCLLILLLVPLVISTKCLRLSYTDLLLGAYFFFLLGHNLLIRNDQLVEDSFILQVLLLIIFFAGRSLWGRGSKSRIALLILMGFGFYQAFLGFLQLHGYAASHGQSPITGSFFNPGPYGGYLASVFPIALGMFVFTKSETPLLLLSKYSGLVVSIFILSIILLVNSRASWMALTVGSSYILFKYYNVPSQVSKYLKSSLTRFLSILLVTSILISAGLWIFYLKKDSGFGRILMWKISTQVIAENPWIGVGHNHFRVAFSERQADYFKQGSYSDLEARVAGNGEYAFNEFLGIGVEEGLIGLALFFFFVTRDSFYLKSSKIESGIHLSVAGGVLSILIFALFSYPFSISSIAFNLYFYLSILAGRDQNAVTLRLTRPARYLLSVFLLVLSVFIFREQWLRYQGMKKWHYASQMRDLTNYELAIAGMEEVYDLFKNNGQFMFEYGQSLAFSQDFEKGRDVLNRAKELTSDPYLFIALGNCHKGLGEYAEAEYAYLHAFYLMPHKFYPRYLLAQMFIEMGEIDKAKEIAKQTMEMPIKIASPAVDEILREMKRILKL